MVNLVLSVVSNSSFELKIKRYSLCAQSHPSTGLSSVNWPVVRPLLFPPLFVDLLIDQGDGLDPSFRWTQRVHQLVNSSHPPGLFCSNGTRGLCSIPPPYKKLIQTRERSTKASWKQTFFVLFLI